MKRILDLLKLIRPDIHFKYLREHHPKIKSNTISAFFLFFAIGSAYDVIPLLRIFSNIIAFYLIMLIGVARLSSMHSDELDKSIEELLNTPYLNIEKNKENHSYINLKE